MFGKQNKTIASNSFLIHLINLPRCYLNLPNPGKYDLMGLKLMEDYFQVRDKEEEVVLDPLSALYEKAWKKPTLTYLIYKYHRLYLYLINILTMN